MENHATDFTFKCDKCDKILTTKKYFELHKRSCHPEKYICDICGLQFHKYIRFINHMNKHNTAKSDDSDSDSDDSDSESVNNTNKKLHHRSYKIKNKNSLLDNFSQYRKRFTNILERAFQKSPIKFLISALGEYSQNHVD